MLINELLDKEYENLKSRVEQAGYSHYFTSTDVEDMLHDVCLKILEEDIVDTEEWGAVISNVVGSYRRDRTRALAREVRFI